MDWVKENMERVVQIRDQVLANQTVTNTKRKERLDKKVEERNLEINDRVLLRTQIRSPVTYGLDVGHNKPQVAHINSFKKYEERI